MGLALLPEMATTGPAERGELVAIPLAGGDSVAPVSMTWLDRRAGRPNIGE